MPTSDPYNLTPLVTILVRLRPGRLLDVGCGFGKYGMLYREYTDIWDQRIPRDSWTSHIEGIEAFEAYRNPIHDYAYNAVHYKPAQEVLPTLGQFDAVLIADVIEHLELAEAKSLVAECFARSPIVVISTPREFYPQEALCDNEFERHRCTFTARDFPEGIHVVTIRVMSCDIFVASREPLPRRMFSPIEPADFVYLYSRKKLGNAGLPISLALKSVNRFLG